MKILYLVSGIGPPAGWGTEYIQNCIFELSRIGVRATIISPIIKHTHPDWKTWVSQQERKYGVRIIPLVAPAWLKKRLLLHLALTPILVTWAAMKLMLYEKFDIVHEFSSTPIILVRSLLFRFLFKTKSVFSLSVFNNTVLGSFYWFRLLNFSDIYCIPSMEIIDILRNLGIESRKIFFVPPTFDTQLFKRIEEKKSARNKLNIPQDKKVVSFFGSLTKEKGISDLVEAIDKLNSNLKKDLLVTIFAVWKGSNNHSFWVQKLRNAGSVVKIKEGLVSIPQVISASDVIILPQRTGHGTTIPPISVLEVLASNAPLITTDIVGNREIVKGSDIVVQPERPDELTKAIEKTLWGKSKMKRSFDSRPFELKTVAQKYYGIYQVLVKQ